MKVTRHPAAIAQPWSIREFYQALTSTLQADPRFQHLWLRGEIKDGGLHQASGHYYFQLKDTDPQATGLVKCAWFRNARKPDELLPENGEVVDVWGRLSVYEPRGDYSIVVAKLERTGVGQAYLAFLALQNRLRAEGLFDRPRTPMPPFPRQIAVVTSLTGAVRQDIETTIRRRFPLIVLHLVGAPMQGADAPPRIIAALEFAANLPAIDAVILARGGGSATDLACFNDEALTRYLAAYPLPVVTAIGHETDTTLVDMASDLRAPTPTAAAELLTPDLAELQVRLGRLRTQLDQRLRNRLDTAEIRLGYLAESLRQAGLRVLQHANRRVEMYQTTLQAAAWQTLDDRRTLLERLEVQLEALHPMAILNRGYVQVEQGNRPIQRKNQLNETDVLTLHWVDGSTRARLIPPGEHAE
jgi:exodeoxyribonuclease VII large subunit